MNSINGLNFYDALTKFIIGFLITFWWLPEIINCGSAYCSCGVSLNAVQTFLYGIFCFIAGFIWQMFYDICGKLWKVSLCVSDCILGEFSDCFRSITGRDCLYYKCKRKCKSMYTCTCFFCDLVRYIFCETRNNAVWIKRAKCKIENEIAKMEKNTPTNYEYYKAYYKNVNDPIGSVKILEAHEAFLRNIIFLFFPVTPLVSCIDKFFNLPSFPFCFDWRYIFALGFIDLFLFGVWRKIQFKIHELVWEANYYKE